jgi:uncharacterized membrane protein YphA (DoxX/SURF4 family)
VYIALVIATVLLTAMPAISASMKLRKHDQVVAIIGGTVGVPARALPVLAGLELAGAAGILIGLWRQPLGIAAAVGLVAYVIGVVIGHPRRGHEEPHDAAPTAGPRRRCPGPPAPHRLRTHTHHHRNR